MPKKPSARRSPKNARPTVENHGRINPAVEILAFLYDRDDRFASIDELSTLIDRGAVEVRASLDRLAESGHELEYSPASGIRLRRPVKLDGYLIERNLGTRRIGRNVIVFDEVESTNDVAFSAANQAGADGLVVLAESQRAGRGRLGRKWMSRPGEGILMSILLAGSPQPPHEALTIAAGLSVAQATGKYCRSDCLLKWPNDVLIDSAKLSGVLVEVRNVSSGRATVTGIGVNVYSAPADGLDRPAACLSDHSRGAIERIELVRDILTRIDDWVAAIEQGKIEDLKKCWLEHSAMLNNRISVCTGGKKISGRVVDVSPLEGLILLDDAGNRHILPAGSTTVLD